MGFWSSFFGHAAANAVSEMKKEERKNKEWNDLFYRLGEYETAFTKYLESVGCKACYIADVEAVNNGNISPEIRKMENLKKKVEEYIAIGGDARILYDLDDIDKHIEKLKYLRSIGQLERQYEFRDDNKYVVQDKIKAEQEEIERQQEQLRNEQKELHQQEVNRIVGSDINTLSGIDFEGVCQQLVEQMGFETETTKASGDGGIDLIAYNHQPLLSGKYIIQCKRYSGSVGEPIIRDLFGVVTSERANKGILMTTGYFTPSAIKFAEGKPIELIDGEKLSELLRQYNLNYDDAEKIVVEEEPFNPEAFMGYYYYRYENLKEIVNRDAGDIRSRCLLVEMIHTAIKMRLGLLDLGDNGTFELKTEDVQEMINILEEYLQPLVRNDNSRSSNKKLQYIYYMSLLIDGECSILKGDFVNAVEKYSKVLNMWNELDEDNELFKVDLVYSLFAVFKLFGLTELIDKYYNRYRTQIETQKRYCNESTFMSDYNKVQSQKLSNKYDVNQYVAFTLFDVQDDDVSVLYDNGIDDWGSIQIRFGSAVIDVNKEKNYLYFHSKNTWKKKEQETILVRNIDAVIERQKNLIKQL